MTRTRQTYQEIFQITKWKDDAVFETKSLGYHWINSDERAPEGYIFAPASTHVVALRLAREWGTNRTVSEEMDGYSRSLRPPCEICKGPHPTYHCCDECNYDRHRCHFCGEYLGHSEKGHCDPEGNDA